MPHRPYWPRGNKHDLNVTTPAVAVSRIKPPTQLCHAEMQSKGSGSLHGTFKRRSSIEVPTPSTSPPPQPSSASAAATSSSAILSPNIYTIDSRKRAGLASSVQSSLFLAGAFGFCTINTRTCGWGGGGRMQTGLPRRALA